MLNLLNYFLQQHTWVPWSSSQLKWTRANLRSEEPLQILQFESCNLIKLKRWKKEVHVASQGLQNKIIDFNQVVEMAFPGCSWNDGIPPSLSQHQAGQSPTTGALTRASAGCTWDRATLAVCMDWRMRLESSWGTGLGVLRDGKLNMSQRCPGSQIQPCPGEPGKAGHCPPLLWPGLASPPVLGAAQDKKDNKF